MYREYRILFKDGFFYPQKAQKLFGVRYWRTMKTRKEYFRYLWGVKSYFEGRGIDAEAVSVVAVDVAPKYRILHKNGEYVPQRKRSFLWLTWWEDIRKGGVRQNYPNENAVRSALELMAANQLIPTTHKIEVVTE